MERISELERKEFVFSEDNFHISYLHAYPITPGTSIVESKNNHIKCIFELSLDEFKILMFHAKNAANLLCNKLQVLRCALLFEPVKEETGHPQIKVIPLHGIINSEWKPIVCDDSEYFDVYPGYCNSKNGPRMQEDMLSGIQNKIRSKLETQSISYEFFGDQNDSSLFSRIVQGKEKQWRVWEDSENVAFLTPFPNAPGFTVIIPRQHLTSDIFSLENKDYEKLIEAAYKVSTLLKSSLLVKSTCMIFEGFEIDYAHIKLIPVFESSEKNLAKNLPTDFHSKYMGYVTSLNGNIYPKDEMSKIFKLINS